MSCNGNIRKYLGTRAVSSEWVDIEWFIAPKILPNNLIIQYL